MTMLTRRAASGLLLASTVAGTIVGSLMVYVGLQHNPQGEFYRAGTESLDWGSIAFLFGSWFVATSVLCAVIGAGFTIAYRMLRG